MKSIKPFYLGVLVFGLITVCLATGVASRIAGAQPGAARSALEITVEAIGESVEELDAGVYLAGTTREAAGVYEGGQEIMVEAVAHNPDYWRFHKWTGALESSRNPCSLITKLTGSTMKLTAQFTAHSMHDYTDLFKRPGMPADQWDIRPDTGFDMAKGALEGLRVPRAEHAGIHHVPARSRDVRLVLLHRRAGGGGDPGRTHDAGLGIAPHP